MSIRLCGGSRLEELDLQEFHEQLLEILCEFDRICRKYKIRYSLAYGTLLGAVRHKGFIPWDDDVDIIMDRENYEYFNKIAALELKKCFFLQNIDTDKNYFYNITRIRKNNTAMIYKKWINAGFHQGIYIDISPCDRLADSKVKWGFQKWAIILLTPIRASGNKEIFYGTLGKSLATKVLFRLFRCLPTRLLRKIEYYYITKYDNTTSQKIGIICEGGVLLHPSKDMLPFSQEVLSSYVDIEFEGYKFMCTSKFDDILRFWYGDYMQLPPLEQRRMFHQPLAYSTTESFEKVISDLKERQNESYLADKF